MIIDMLAASFIDLILENQILGWLFLAALYWLTTGVICMVVARSKGRNALGWLILGASFSGFAIITLALMPSLKEQPKQEDVLEAQHRALYDRTPCPYCAEEIKRTAKVCPFCRHDVAEKKATNTHPKSVSTPERCPACKALQPKGSQVCPECYEDFRLSSQLKV